MKFKEIINEYKTKLGQEITFTFDKDIESENRGWIVDKITAYVEGLSAGYIKIENIPQEQFENYYPTIFNFMAQIAGMGNILPLNKRHLHYNELTDDELDKLIKSIGGIYSKYSDYWNEYIPVPENRDQKLELISDMEKNLDLTREKFDKFVENTVDKPLVAYISVEEEFQRNRIAIALYFTAADWLKKQGLKLYASGNQTGSSKTVWDYMEKHFDVAYDGNRRYLEV